MGARLMPLMSLLRRTLLVLVLAAALLALPGAFGAQAPWQPARPIEFVIMAGKGGGADLIVRSMIGIIEKHKLVPVPFTPVNITGGSGADAMMYLKKKTGD